MKYVDDYRDPRTSRLLVESIRRVVSRPRVLMEVCGGQTHGLVRHGIDQALTGIVELIHGPGCPVCVTPAADIDHAIDLCQRPGVTVTTFGDMLRVPGTAGSLRDASAAGGSVKLVYSPLDAVQLAQQHPAQQFVFFAVGFETTTPATALAIVQAQRLELKNFSLLVSHVRVQPAMELIMSQPGCRVEGFLAAGHVCAVSGFESYDEFAKRFEVPVVVTGFEPVDLLSGILACVEQLEAGQSRVENHYGRSVQASGNPAALGFINDVYEVSDRNWRGLGTIAAGGYRLRPALRDWDARYRYRLSPAGEEAPTPCPSGEVLMGRLNPKDCPFFGAECSPDHPLGAPMVSGEGACAAYYHAISPSSSAS